MKIFNNENGVRKVYVQMDDIMMINRLMDPIPASIYEKVFTGSVIVDDSNIMDFVEFSQPSEIDFFKSMDWIADYKQIRNLSEEEIIEKTQDIVIEMNEIANRFNAMSDKEKKENLSLVKRHNLLDYKKKYLEEILLIKQRYQQIPFPVVPDSDCRPIFSDGNGNCNYEIQASLDPNKLLFFRKDGKKLSTDDKIPLGFLNAGIHLAIEQNIKRNEFFGAYEMNHYLSENKQYRVIEFKVKEYEKNVQEEMVEKKGIKILLKKFFNRNKK